MSILSFFWPQVLEKVVSPISGEIKVIEQFGKRRLEIGGMTQSGGLVEKIWKKAIKEVSKVSKVPRVSRVLILGLGAGTVAKLLSLNTKYHMPYTKMIGVEIDPEVIRLGKKYFGLGEIENLEIVIADAIRFVNQQFSHLTIKPFDLILVDLYQGREVPKKCQSKKFLQSLKSLRSSRGLIIFNRLYSKDKRQETDQFVQQCQGIFDRVETKKALCNLMIFCE